MVIVGHWFLTRTFIAEFHLFDGSYTLCKNNFPIHLTYPPGVKLPPNFKLIECQECQDIGHRITIMKELAV